jgi:hypothetical protein
MPREACDCVSVSTDWRGARGGQEIRFYGLVARGAEVSLRWGGLARVDGACSRSPVRPMVPFMDNW